MSIECSARVVYGVSADVVAICDFRDNNEFEWYEICDKWVIVPDINCGSDEFIIGFCMDSVEEGDFTELDQFIESPPEEDINELHRVLERLGIKEKPRWFLVCQIF